MCVEESPPSQQVLLDDTKHVCYQQRPAKTSAVFDRDEVSSPDNAMFTKVGKVARISLIGGDVDPVVWDEMECGSQIVQLTNRPCSVDGVARTPN